MNINNPLVSIAMTTYNGEKYLFQQLESIANQTYKNFEVIIADDCSADGTLNIIENFRTKMNIRLYSNKKHFGVSKNFEKAVSLCNGDYIALCDQDDIWCHDKIEILLNEIGKYALISSDASLINHAGIEIYPSWIRYQLIGIPSEKNQFKKIIFQNFALGCTMLFRKDLKEKIIPIQPEVEGHDWWIALIASLNGKIKFINNKLVKKRVHEFNVTNIYPDSHLSRFFRFFINKDSVRRQVHYSNSIIRLKFYIDNKVYFSLDEKKYLEDMLLFYSSYFNGFIHFTSFRIAFKYRNILYENYNIVSKTVHLIAKLFN